MNRRTGEGVPSMSDAKRWMGRLGVGWLMGLAVVIPGVSAGTVALLLGVYPEWVRGMSRLQLVRLAPLIMGLVGGVLSGVRLVRWGIAATPDATSALFLGIMLVAVLGFLRNNPPRGIHQVATVASCAFAWWLALVSLVQPLGGVEAPSDAAMAIAGAVGAAAMTLPGISGGTVLILMGLYHPTIELVAGWHWVPMAFFGAGALAGIVLIARIIRAVLMRWEAPVMAVLAGLMIGSMRALLPAGGWSPVSGAAFLVGAILCAVLVFGRRR